MADLEGLRQMSARDVYGAAVRDGHGVAVTRAATRGTEDALKQWHQQHPEFSDPVIARLLHEGQELDLLDILKYLSTPSANDE